MVEMSTSLKFSTTPFAMACKGVSRVQSISMTAIMIGYRLFKVASAERQVKVKVKVKVK
jgi:hypothetical protein